MFCFLSTFSCTGKCKCASCDPGAGDPVQKLLSVVWTRNAELLNLLHVVEQVWSNEHAGDGNIVVWQKNNKQTNQRTKNRIKNNVDNVLVSQLLIKATYFLYRFNYLFCHIELINRRRLSPFVSFSLTKCAPVGPTQPRQRLLMNYFTRHCKDLIGRASSEINILIRHIVCYAVEGEQHTTTAGWHWMMCRPFGVIQWVHRHITTRGRFQVKGALDVSRPNLLQELKKNRLCIGVSTRWQPNKW